MHSLTVTLWTCPFPIIRGVWLDFIVMKFCRISELHANSEDSDLMPHSAASDLGVHCLPMSLLWDSSLKQVNVNFWSIYRFP